ncbi:MAG: hypothetical protein OZSIB_2931 [Candidatus Ozemobacter sibiricus]|jgi:DNA-binding transcriptional ArsR family regulator|uniref:HTH marR-type domain-containing protein n=1 Tax=Candidatus Ozemobacter sibiricus TaxID=2268124 RepID=A0A367ZR61_9BACT|nr:MAG: hypothetical protein OZSIB_2931 [Candidatus Ozemobacter sibiricus]
MARLSSSPKQAPARSASLARARAPWTFLTNHAHVLLSIGRTPDIRMRDLAARVGITERAVQRIVADLVEAGYLETERAGRRNRYRVRTDRPLRHAVTRHRSVGTLFDLIHELEPLAVFPPRSDEDGAPGSGPSHTPGKPPRTRRRPAGAGKPASRAHSFE